ncbi:MAG: endo alpha-1,4 polygalactosaminidase [Cellvibrionaceae bacterium]
MRLLFIYLISAVLLIGCKENGSSTPTDEVTIPETTQENPVIETTETDTATDNTNGEELPVINETTTEVEEESSDNEPEAAEDSTDTTEGAADDTATESDGGTTIEENDGATSEDTTEGSSEDEDPAAEEETTDESSSDWYKPSPLATWQWQLSGTVNTSYGVDIYDIDLFDSPTSLIDELHSKGIKVICYFSGGSYEEWRDDANQFTENDMGNNLDGWPGERWLDIRTTNVKNIMKARLDVAVEKGCDGVEPDNMDGYTNNPGVNINAQDQLTYNKFIATEAHARNLSVALKNDLDQVAELVDFFDFAVNEQCYQYNECDLLKPFTDSGKAILNAEYKNTWKNDANERADLCADANAAGISTLVLPLNLDDNFRHSCL